LLDAVIGYLGDGNEWAAARLAREPGWVIDSALRDGSRKVFAAHLTQLDSYEIAGLRLGKKSEALLEEAATLHKQLDRYAYGTPSVRFTESDVDQARAAGVLVEFENARPVDPEAEARRERGRQLRAIAEQAHGTNLDLGWGLMNGLATVDPADMTVARFFTYAVLGPDYDQSPYTQTGDRVAELAARGVRLVVEEFRADVTKTRKDGSKGALRIDYGDPRKPEKPIAWLWKFIDGAKTAGELYGRALVVIAAEQYASRLVVPQSQQHSPMRWRSHKDHARKALAKLAGPHLPTTLKQLEKAVAKAHAEHENATSRRASTGRAAAGEIGEAEMEPAAAGDEVNDELDVDEREDDLEDEDLDDPLPDSDDEIDDVAGVVGPDGGLCSGADPGL
jgi:hypothetical protein